MTTSESKIETRIEKYQGRGNKPDEFAIVEVLTNGEEGSTYPRYTKAELRNHGHNGAEVLLEIRKKRDEEMLKGFKKYIKNNEGADNTGLHPLIQQEKENALTTAKHWVEKLEGKKLKIVHFKYKMI